MWLAFWKAGYVGASISCTGVSKWQVPQSRRAHSMGCPSEETVVCFSSHFLQPPPTTPSSAPSRQPREHCVLGSWYRSKAGLTCSP